MKLEMKLWKMFYFIDGVQHIAFVLSASKPKMEGEGVEVYDVREEPLDQPRIVHIETIENI